MGRRLIAALAAAAGLLGASRAWAGQVIVVSNYGVAANGMPYAVALAKGFFKAAGADVSRILSSQGGDTTLRNLKGGDLDYAEVDLAGAVSAIRQGEDLHIVSDNVLTVGEFVWAVQPRSPVRRVQDFRGRRIGYTNARSASQVLTGLLLRQGGLAPQSVTEVQAGGFGEQMVALNLGLIDVAALPEPAWSRNADRLRPVARAADALPPLANVVGVATGRAIRTRGAFLRGVLEGRRRAVDYIYAHPDESAAIVAQAYGLDLRTARAAIHNLIASSQPRPGRPASMPYWGEGRFDMAGMNRMVAAQQAAGALGGPVDLGRAIDRRFLPPDLQADY